ncbi:MAG: YiiD C-terminal domain-containing protein [Spirochaetales bacterium]|nr:YiiD C-terminal domain-containing protein [Spirochaetales bacterium]
MKKAVICRFEGMDIVNPKDELQKLIEDEIPLAGSGGFKVTELSTVRVRIGGDLSLNRNHHGTVFGGSQSVALILSGWAMVRELMMSSDPDASIVIASQTVDYLLPVEGDFEARCSAPDSKVIEAFYSSYRERGKAKITLTAELYSLESSRPGSRMSCLFVAKKTGC